MEYLKTFESYNDDLILERLDLQPLLNLLKSSINKNAIATLIVGSLLAISTVTQATNFIENRPDLSHKDKVVLVQAIKKYKDPLTMRLSQSGWDHIRREENFSDTAYDLKDGRITIGFGHSEPINNSKYEVGDKISRTEANKLFIVDMNIAAKGVRRIFEEWAEQGINVKLTQKQYDVLTSLAYNMGINGLRKSKFIQLLKKNQLTKASKLIKITGVDNKYPGLELRRNKEYRMFIS